MNSEWLGIHGPALVELCALSFLVSRRTESLGFSFRGRPPLSRADPCEGREERCAGACSMVGCCLKISGKITCSGGILSESGNK